MNRYKHISNMIYDKLCSYSLVCIRRRSLHDHRGHRKLNMRNLRMSFCESYLVFQVFRSKFPNSTSCQMLYTYINLFMHSKSPRKTQESKKVIAKGYTYVTSGAFQLLRRDKRFVSFAHLAKSKLHITCHSNHR